MLEKRFDQNKNVRYTCKFHYLSSYVIVFYAFLSIMWATGSLYIMLSFTIYLFNINFCRKDEIPKI